MPRVNRVTIPPVPALLLSMMSIQAGAAFAKTLFPVLGAAGTTAMRVALAAALLVALLRPRLRALSAAQWRAVVPYGLALGLMNLCFYASLVHLPLGLAVTLEFVGPLVLSLALSRRALDFVWVALAGVGIALIMPHGASGGEPLHMGGVALALLAGALWALYIVAGGEVGRRVPGTTGVVAGMLVAALVALPFGLVQAGADLFTPALLAAGLGVAIMSSAVPYTMEMVALKAIPARVFGVMMSLEPALAALSGLLFLGERLNTLQWVAMGCVIAASAGIHLSAPRVAEPSTPAELIT